jgi:hypothetical protein
MYIENKREKNLSPEAPEVKGAPGYKHLTPLGRNVHFPLSICQPGFTH